MKIKLKGLPNLNEVKALILPVFEESEISQEDYPRNLKEVLEQKNTDRPFLGKKGSTRLLPLFHQEFPQMVVLIGMGKREDLNPQSIATNFGKAVQKCYTENYISVGLDLTPLEGTLPLKSLVQTLGKSLILSKYSFNKYKQDSSDETPPIETVYLFSRDEEELFSTKSALEEGISIGEGICFARDLVNEPANVMTPSALAQVASVQGEIYGLDVKILDENEMNRLGMEAFLNVSKGSSQPPKLIVMRYQGNPSSDQIYGLVGKGLTYDSGGYSIKPTGGMLTMKMDMGGAASAIGTIAAVAKNRLKVNLTVVIAACENMISGNAYRPGDVIGSMAGKTIEITNTDAEGRLTLADAVHFIIDQEKVNSIIDIATLTGAALVALGKNITPYLSSTNEGSQQLEDASKNSLEKIWRLPAESDYHDLLKSEIADMKNSGPRLAGTIVAGLFIEKFTQSLPWIHLDIAGTSWQDKKGPLSPVGGTGSGVDLLYQYYKIQSRSKKE